MRKFHLAILFFLAFFIGHAQKIQFQITGEDHRSIHKSQLDTAKHLLDINPAYPSSWIKEHVSVKISATCNNQPCSEEGVEASLTAAQRVLLKKTDYGSRLSVDISYHPSHPVYPKEIKQIFFSYTITPEVSAASHVGKSGLNQYISNSIIAQLPSSLISSLQLASFTFIVDENGDVENPNIQRSTQVDIIDQQVLNALKNMPPWLPAKNQEGKNVKQLFTLSIGHQIGC